MTTKMIFMIMMIVVLIPVYLLFGIPAYRNNKKLEDKARENIIYKNEKPDH